MYSIYYLVSVVQSRSCVHLFDPIDYSTPSSSVLNYPQSFLKFMSIELVMLSNHLIFFSPFFLCLQSFPA